MSDLSKAESILLKVTTMAMGEKPATYTELGDIVWKVFGLGQDYAQLLQEEMSYTNGEWFYTEELGANFSMISNKDVVICGMPNPLPCDTYDKELNEMRANAHLIAAAPAMYEALKLLLKRKEELKFKYPIELELPIVWAERALAKVEGK